LAQSPNIYLSLLLKSSSKEKPFLTLRLVRTLLRVDQFRRPLAATLFRSIHLGFLGAAVAGCRGPGIQPAREFPPNKTKENQRIPRKNAWISLDFFGRFGAFQWVTSEKNKIFRSLSQLASQVVCSLASNAFPFSFLLSMLRPCRDPSRRGLFPAAKDKIA
jgi:hypothetical protein